MAAHIETERGGVLVIEDEFLVSLGITADGVSHPGAARNDRTSLHMLRLAEHLNSTNEALAAFLSGMGDAPDVASPALAQLWARTFREAQTLTFADAFLLIMRVFLAAIAFVPLLRKTFVAPGPVSQSH